jgi:hypothetical protein
MNEIIIRKRKSASFNRNVFEPIFLILFMDGSNSKVNNKIKKFTIKLEGSIVKEHKVDVIALGWFLLNFQSLIDSFLELQYTKKELKKKSIRQISRLYFRGISEGSAILGLETSPQMVLSQVYSVEKAYNEFLDITKKINEDPDMARTDLSQKFINISDRIRVEQKMYEIFTDKYTTGFGSNGKYIYPKQSMRETIEEWVDEDSRKGTEEIKGAMIRLKLDAPGYFSIISQDNKDIIKCKYRNELLEKIIDLVDKPVIIRGVVKRGVRKLEMKELLDLNPWEFEEVNKIGKFKLKNDLKLKVDYDDDLWCLEAIELNSVGSGYSYNDAIKSLEENILDNIYILAHKFKDSELSKKDKEVKQKLLQYISSKDIEGLDWED